LGVCSWSFQILFIDISQWIARFYKYITIDLVLQVAFLWVMLTRKYVFFCWLKETIITSVDACSYPYSDLDWIEISVCQVCMPCMVCYTKASVWFQFEWSWNCTIGLKRITTKLHFIIIHTTKLHVLGRTSCRETVINVFLIKLYLFCILHHKITLTIFVWQVILLKEQFCERTCVVLLYQMAVKM
jgi:hypothetical protein